MHTAVILLVCAVILVVATLAGAAAGYLARRDDATYPAAIARAATAFAATLTLATVIVPRLAG
ncbi:hypothetical protein [Kitasatospora sp. NPDC056184]|uniref:hypothetical protein n=1 Tax=Kitasatospora sp. NPDC056184 TaxID=3345738 RepID=UPI0035E393D8